MMARLLVAMTPNVVAESYAIFTRIGAMKKSRPEGLHYSDFFSDRTSAHDDDGDVLA
jgi:hypothetical protein